MYKLPMRAHYLLVLVMIAATRLTAGATPYNIAPKAKITASSQLDGHQASAVADGVIGIPGKGDWASVTEEWFWGESEFPWLKLEWDEPVTVGRLVLYDRNVEKSHTAAVTLTFSDGSRVDVGCIPADGRGRSVDFAARTTEYIKIDVIDGDGSNLGLSEIEVYPSPAGTSDFIELVDPYIETARGRYFFFATGSMPTGMMSAAPLTRNKNQGGGGYNYNDYHILGFPQIHAWMLSGITFMPADSSVNYTLGEQNWKSSFSHDSEIVRPGYHRVYLDDYNAWVEQTVTERTSIYRTTYTKDTDAAIMFNLGGYVGTSTMVNANVVKESPTMISGSVATVGRLWGGPDSVRIYFVAEFDRPMDSMDAWDAGADTKVLPAIRTDASELHSTSPSVARNEGMSYHDAPTAGVAPRFKLRAGDQLLTKISISYVSVDNARSNLERENPGWNFDTTLNEATSEWNDWLGRISVTGGSDAQRVKFYTDLWHTLLGRHKIDDCNGEYPDRTHARIEGKHTLCDAMRIGQIAKGKDGKPIHHMYNSDALWLTQWNQNTLWGLAYPELIDDFSASLLEYAANGKLLPRGPCGGSYSFIMSGCPATSMITSAFQRGLNLKWNPKEAYKAIRRNHEPGGMLGYNSESEFDFYLTHGYAPDRAGLTVEWVFEDWALSEMAEAMGKNKDAERYRQRSRGWKSCIHPELHLILPRRSDGTWLHTDPLNGWGFEEANSWQTTFGLSNDIPGLIETVGSADTLCSMLDFALCQSVDQDFVGGYGTGYVSYANQPGLSTAHVFSHAGKPWLTQYWVRQVNEKAYGSTDPFRGYGGHDEDQGQMSGVSALMSIGLFSINGCSARNPYYEITSPVFDRVDISLNPDYYPGGTLSIITHGNSADNCYIDRAEFNGTTYNSFRLPHTIATSGGELHLWLSPSPNTTWGIE